jgi:hypothetical protein
MSDQDIFDYFKDKTLPEILRLDRATTQFEVKDAVKRNIEALKGNSQDHHAKHRLLRIIDAIDKPYSGPELPRL